MKGHMSHVKELGIKGTEKSLKDSKKIDIIRWVFLEDRRRGAWAAQSADYLTLGFC